MSRPEPNFLVKLDLQPSEFTEVVQDALVVTLKLQRASQLFIQIAAALLKCAELKSAHPEAYVAMAIPDHPGIRNRVGRIEPTLKAADIGVLWVAEDGTATGWKRNADWL